MTGLARPASAATTIRFVTDWKAQAEHGGFYQALAEGLYAKRGLDVKIIQGGPDVNVPQLLAGGAADFGMGSNSFIPLNLVKQNVPLRAVMAIFQKDPQVLMSPSAPRHQFAGRHARQADPDLGRHHDRLLALAARQVRLSATARSANTPTIWRPSSWIPMPSRKAISPASLSRSSNRRISTPKIFLLSDYGYPGYANMVLVPQKWIDTNRQRGAGCSWTPPATAGCTIWTIRRKGNALIKRDNPDMTDAILAQALDKMKRYEMLISGDGRAFGLGSMTDAQWKHFYDTMASEGLYPKGLDYKQGL